MVGWAIVMIVLLVNCASFICARQQWMQTEMVGAELEDWSEEWEEDGTLTYLIAGNLNQPRAAFQFLAPELKGRVRCVNYRATGFSTKEVANQLTKEIAALEPRKVIIYTISLGDQVARYMEVFIHLSGVADSAELEIIAINPCPAPQALIWPLERVIKIGAPLFEAACHALGWLSTVPLIPTAGGRYSLVLLADQYWAIAYGHPPWMISQTTGVICSQVKNGADNDGLLNNVIIRDYFTYTGMQADWLPKMVTIESKHGDTIGAAEKYLKAVRELQRLQTAPAEPALHS